VNFLSLLNKGIGANYVLNDGAFEYMARQKLPQLIQERLFNKADTLNEKTHWESWLDELKCELRAEISFSSQIKQLKISAFSFMPLVNSTPLIFN
jgi:hypothetical protein